jgi:phosphatidylinositol alpha-1,6-mannosyltransferase
MRVLGLLTDGFGALGGISRYNSDLLTAIAQVNEVADVIALSRHADRLQRLPAKVVEAGPASSRMHWAALAVQLAFAQSFDVILCGHINALPLAASIARIRRTPLWLQVHGIEAWAPRPSLRPALRAVDLVTSVSRYTRRRLLNWSDLEPERVRVLPNTFTAVAEPRDRRADLIARFGLAERRVILTVGRLASSEQYKGHDRILRALPRLAKDAPDVIYMIGGTGDDAPRLAALAQESGVADRVIFAGPLPPADLPDYFSLADVFAMPSTGEGFGIVFLEAASHGLPVIGGNADGSVDALAEGAIGMMINPLNNDELVMALHAALERRPTFDPKIAVQRFAFSNFARHVHGIIQTFS